MARWKSTVSVADVFHNDGMTLAAKADVIAKRFRLRFADDDVVEELTDELVDAGNAGDVRWFDEVWDYIYDWADVTGVWIETSRP